MYNKRGKDHDEKMAESWTGDAEGILVFVREQFTRFYLRY